MADVVVRVGPLGLRAEAFRPLWEAAAEYHGLLDGPDPQPLPVCGRGIGGLLVDAVIGELAARRVPVVLVSFWPQNRAARRFYERHGFRADAGGRHRRPVASAGA